MPVGLPGPLAGPFLVPILMTVVSTAVVQMYGVLTIQALDIIEGGWWCRVQTLVEINPRVYLHPSLLWTCLHQYKGIPEP